MIRKVFNFFKRYTFEIKKKSSANPIASKIISTNEYYIKILNEVKNKTYKEIDLFEKKLEFKINSNWLINLALKTQISIKQKTEANYQHGRILYTQIRDHLKNYNVYETYNVFETGTSVGFSSICISKAIEDSEHKNSRIFTIDIIPSDKPIYWNKFGDEEGKRTRLKILQEWNKELKNIVFLTGDTREVMQNLHLHRINFAFLDAVHNKKYLSREFDYVSKRQIKGDLIIFDDINVTQYPELVSLLKKLEDENLYVFEYIKSTESRGYAIGKKK